MQLGLGHGGLRAVVSPISPRMLIAAGALLAGALAGCTTDGQPSLAATAQPRGATVAFESIDGPPQGQFQALVRNLNEEAQSRRLAVISRENPSAYRVRGYLSAKVEKDRSTIAWVWDVFDRDEQRALRISGEEVASRPVANASEAWKVADDAMLRRIAVNSMDQLASFLTSGDAAPNAPTAAAPVAFLSPDTGSPEAAGIYRIFQAKADPVPENGGSNASGIAPGVPLPPRRPDDGEAARPVPQRSASL